MRSFLSACLIGLLATSAPAQVNNCAPRPMVLERLSDRFGETRQSIGLDGSGVQVEVFANEQTGTWTIILTNPHGLSCVVSAGESFERLHEELPAGDPT